MVVSTFGGRPPDAFVDKISAYLIFQGLTLVRSLQHQHNKLLSQVSTSFRQIVIPSPIGTCSSRKNKLKNVIINKCSWYCSTGRQGISKILLKFASNEHISNAPNTKHNTTGGRKRPCWYQHAYPPELSYWSSLYWLSFGHQPKKWWKSSVIGCLV